MRGHDLLEWASPDRPEGVGERGVPVDGTERRLGLVLETELDQLGGVLAHEPCGKVEATVDAGGDAGGGEELAVLDPPGLHGLGAEELEDVGEGPVRRGRASVEEAGGRQDQRPGADRHDDLGGGAGVGDVVDERLVAAGAQGRFAGSGHDDAVGRRDLVERVAGDEADDRVRLDRVAGLSDDHHVERGVDARQRAERLQRADQVERGEAWVDDEGELLLVGGGHGCSSLVGHIAGHIAGRSWRSTGRPCSTQSSLPPGYTETDRYPSCSRRRATWPELVPPSRQYTTMSASRSGSRAPASSSTRPGGMLIAPGRWASA